LTRDSVDDVNLYAYCSDNPVIAVDPTGLSSVVLGKSVNTLSELWKLSDIALVARTIYAENNDENNYLGQQAVAWTIFNRYSNGGFAFTIKNGKYKVFIRDFRDSDTEDYLVFEDSNMFSFKPILIKYLEVTKTLMLCFLNFVSTCFFQLAYNFLTIFLCLHQMNQ